MYKDCATVVQWLAIVASVSEIKGSKLDSAKYGRLLWGMFSRYFLPLSTCPINEEVRLEEVGLQRDTKGNMQRDFKAAIPELMNKQDHIFLWSNSSKFIHIFLKKEFKSMLRNF